MSATAYQDDGATDATIRLAHDDASDTPADRATPEPEWRQATAYIERNPNPPPALKKFVKHQWVRVSRSSGGTRETVEAKVKKTQPGDGKWEYYLEDEKGRPVWMDNITWFTENQLEKVDRKKS